MNQSPSNTSIINTKLLPFNATAFHNGEFVELSEKDVAENLQEDRGWCVLSPSYGVAVLRQSL